MSQLRAFLAVDLDDDLKPKIYKIIKQFKEIDTKINYVELDNLHLTLKFFGDIDVEGLDVLEKSIQKVITDFDSFKNDHPNITFLINEFREYTSVLPHWEIWGN